MGFGLGSFGKKFKKAFKGVGGFFGGVGKSVEGFGNWLDVTKPGGFGDILTFGSISQAEAQKDAKKAAKDANQMYAEQIAAAEAVSANLAKEEEERKRKLAMLGTQLPGTSKTGYLGVLGAPNIKRSFLS